jgi:hypothetical protein
MSFTNCFDSILALSQRRRVTQHPHDDAMHVPSRQPAPRRILPFTPVPSYSLFDALRPDVKGVPELCPWRQRSAHNNRPQRQSAYVSDLEYALTPGAGIIDYFPPPSRQRH